MLTIRMQRTGRKGFATFRVVVQDSRFSPTSGRVVAQVGHSNPHTKETVLDTEKISEYIKNGAQPSPRVVRLLEAEKVKLPDWVKKSDKSGARKTRNPEKLRKNQPKVEAPVEEPAEEAPVEPAQEVPAETVEEPATDKEVVTESVENTEAKEESKDEEPKAEEPKEATEPEEKPTEA